MDKDMVGGHSVSHTQFLVKNSVCSSLFTL